MQDVFELITTKKRSSKDRWFSLFGCSASLIRNLSDQISFLIVQSLKLFIQGVFSVLLLGIKGF